MAQRGKAYSKVVAESERTHAALEANAVDFAHMEEYRNRLAGRLEAARELSTQQSALTAAKQETSKRLLVAMDEIFKLTSFLRAAIKQRYGSRSEKLVEFGIQPFRGRKLPSLPPTTEQVAVPSLQRPPDLPQ